MRQLAPFLDCLFGAEPDGSLVELRFRLGNGGMGQDFVPVRDRERLARLIAARGTKTDLYLGVAPRSRQEGGADAVERVHALWADCDDTVALEALGSFEPRPSMIVNSGGGRHAYWGVWPPLPGASVGKANRRIAYALGADMRATDAARILRPPETFNFKTGERRPVTVEHVAPETIYTPEQVIGHLPDPPDEKRPPSAPVRPPAAIDDPLLAVPPAVYVELLTGRETGRDGKVSCPFHEDSTPSLHVYEDVERGWTCFGCDRAGTIIDFGAELYGIEPRGRGYYEIRERLEADLIPALRRAAA